MLSARDAAASRQEISEVLCRYAVYVDDGEFDRLETLFASDATFDITPDPKIVALPAIGRQKVRETLEGRYDVVSKVDQRRHLITNIVIDELGDDEAVTRCFLTVLSVPKSGGPVELRGTGVYHDRLRRMDGSWLIAERRLVLDALGT
ncbi:MAG: nuclear transport factor 2 family protein [Rhodospirillaceae bacterium]|nr:nuclear transport factor 2 family protein [Rhodospirillaceae bacterium]